MDLPYINFHTTSPQTGLNDQKERILSDWLIRVSRIGYSMTKKDLPLVMKNILEKSGRRFLLMKIYLALVGSITFARKACTFKD